MGACASMLVCIVVFVLVDYVSVTVGYEERSLSQSFPSPDIEPHTSYIV